MEVQKTFWQAIAMPDDKAKIRNPDRDRINPNEDYELQNWAKHFGVSMDRTQAAVKKVGPMVKDCQTSSKEAIDGHRYGGGQGNGKCNEDG